MAAVCAKTSCRHVASVGQRMPYAYETDAIVAEGETFSLTGEVHDGMLINLSSASKPGPSVAVSWSAGAVTVANGYPGRLRYRAMVLRSADSEFEDLQSCAIAPGQVTTAVISSPAVLFALTSLELVAADTFDACEAAP